jgi:hypothetical protein
MAHPCDGAQIAVFDLDEKVYATVPAAGTVDAALDRIANQMNMRVPLGELLKADLPKELRDVIPKARLVGEERLAGTATDHVAFRGDTADVQLWIPREGEPFPKRIVITYRLAGGQPQFAADLDWNPAPDAPDALFTFTPAEGAERIPVLEAGEQKEPKP